MSFPFRMKPIPRADGVSSRAVRLSLAVRFTDELMFGLPGVLMPTIRRDMGLGYAQIGLLALALNYVAAAIELVGGLLIDVWERRWLLAWGAGVTGLAIVAIGLAPAFPVLLVGVALYGLASGPLAHTADAVLVEAHPEAPERIYARATSFDTVGALLAPLCVAAAFALGVGWRWLLIGIGSAGPVYAVLILRTTFPRPAAHRERRTGDAWSDVRTNLRLVLSNRRAIAWLAFLFAHELFEAPFLLRTVWLAEDVGFGQAGVALFRAMELGIMLVSLVWLDEWLSRTAPRRVLLTALASLLVVSPAWLLIPGVWPRIVLAFPLNFLSAVLWPIGRAESLTSVPGRPGTVTAVSSLVGFVPLATGVALLAEVLTLTVAMLLVQLVALTLMLALAVRMPTSPTAETAERERAV